MQFRFDRGKLSLFVLNDFTPVLLPKVRWVIVKTRLQSNEDPLPERERTMGLIAAEFQVERELAGYTVYRRK